MSQNIKIKASAQLRLHFVVVTMSLLCTGPFFMKKKKEKWLPVIGYGGKYLVSSYGNIINADGSKRKNSIHNGYQVIDLHLNGNRKTHRLGRLVALHFVPNQNNKPYVNHKDGNKSNDYYENLEWCTQKENVNHAFDTGLTSFGEDREGSKLLNIQVLQIFSSTEPVHELAKQYNISVSLIRCIKNGSKHWRITGKERKKKFLSESQVLEIYHSNKSNKTIAQEYGIQSQRVVSIKIGRMWGWLTGKKYNPQSRKRMYNGQMMYLPQICKIEGVNPKSVEKSARTKGITWQDAIKRLKNKKL